MYSKIKLRSPLPFNLSLVYIYNQIRLLGHTADMDEYEKRKLSVFNQVNFLGIIAGFVISGSGLMDDEHLPVIASVVAFSPVIISSVVLFLNYFKRQEWALLVYFTLYPAMTSLVYNAGLDLGLEIFFILYAVLAVFYMAKPVHAIFSFVLSSGCYMFAYVFGGHYFYQLRITNFSFYVFIHLMALTLIFFALYWLKKENIGYQSSILQKNAALHSTNLEIENQKKEISNKANQLEELNSLKNKLFSVISHDLKGPIYAQRNLFQSIQKYDMPGEDIKILVPDILQDMNHTITLMDNLLQWSKSQMESETVRQELTDITSLINNVIKLLTPQAKSKRINLTARLQSSAYTYTDKDMIDLVVRNLISNALKFTKEGEDIVVEVHEIKDSLEIKVIDKGVGMTKEVLEKIRENNFYTTKGTANENGTGLGLMLCKEFLRKNGSSLHINSVYGEGSTFSFCLPL
ncbi:MAG TPA: HAMP domain-containing sensor histidine kinase [Ginsengibacter sp.]